MKPLDERRYVMSATINIENSELQKLLKAKEMELIKLNKLREQNKNHKIIYHESRSFCSSYILPPNAEIAYREDEQNEL